MITNGFEIYRNPNILDYLKDKGIEFTNFLNQGNAKNMDSPNLLSPKQIVIDKSRLFGIRNV